MYYCTRNATINTTAFMYNNKNNEIINLQVKSFENSQNLNATIYDLLNFASNLIKSGFKIVETVILKTNLETLESQQKKKTKTKDKSLKYSFQKVQLSDLHMIYLSLKISIVRGK